MASAGAHSALLVGLLSGITKGFRVCFAGSSISARVNTTGDAVAPISAAGSSLAMASADDASGGSQEFQCARQSLGEENAM